MDGIPAEFYKAAGPVALDTGTPATELECLAQDRSAWHTRTSKAQDVFETNRRDQIANTREARKAAKSSLSTTAAFQCPYCPRIAYAGGHLESGTGVRTVRVLLWQDQGRLPTLAPARLLLLGWMIFALLIGVSYRCKLTAFLTIHKFPERPETVQELAKTGIPSIFPSSIPWIRDFFLTSHIAASREIGENSFLVENAAGGMAAMAANKGANFYERNIIRLSLAENYTNPDGTTDYYIARGTAIPTYGAWFIPHDAPYKDNIDSLLFRMIELTASDLGLDSGIRVYNTGLLISGPRQQLKKHP
ncbi:hypothetical protein Pmani_006632 [Petrolisthes manimaculis]|uniref:Uncharacterized protein n=1 Tax=Petrolisthes manimaculis TaxID=1843537 RepID=A0AAE1UKY2_9EUCA|nr:hypothetical protein Pmani_006632 [Petrolisthes manimaculis]